MNDFLEFILYLLKISIAGAMCIIIIVFEVALSIFIVKFITYMFSFLI